MRSMGWYNRGRAEESFEREEFRNTNVIHQPPFKDREVEGSERLSDFSNRIAQEGSWQRQNSNQVPTSFIKVLSSPLHSKAVWGPERLWRKWAGRQV